MKESGTLTAKTPRTPRKEKLSVDKSELKEVIQEAEQLEEEIVPPQPALPPLAIGEIPVARILIFLISFYLIVFTVRFFMEGPSFLGLIKHLGKEPVPRSLTILYGFFVYMCLACQFFPIPTLPPIAFTAKVFHPVVSRV